MRGTTSTSFCNTAACLPNGKGKYYEQGKVLPPIKNTGGASSLMMCHSPAWNRAGPSLPMTLARLGRGLCPYFFSNDSSSRERTVWSSFSPLLGLRHSFGGRKGVNGGPREIFDIPSWLSLGFVEPYIMASFLHHRNESQPT